MNSAGNRSFSQAVSYVVRAKAAAWERQKPYTAKPSTERNSGSATSPGTPSFRQPATKSARSACSSERARWRVMALRKRSAPAALMPATSIAIWTICSW